MKSLKIYYLSSEIDPFSNTYSLATFSKQFNTILNDYKHIDIRLIQPKYGYISERKYILREVIRLKDLTINFNKKDHIVNLKSAFIPNSRVQLYFMEHKKYFSEIPELLYKSRNGRLYQNNHEKFSFFTKTVIESLDKLFWFPDIIICNDWQMSFLPILFNQKYKKLDKFKKTKIVSMIHAYDDMYKYPNSLFENNDLDYEKKKRSQNTLELAFKYSDLVYMFDDGKLMKSINKVKSLKNSLNKRKHKIIDMSLIEDNSDKIDLYNKIKSDLESLSKK
tara:strand:- start:423 stop:1256 length:834 start_codon:yes stop_codon:yes gene_type:complete